MDQLMYLAIVLFVPAAVAIGFFLGKLNRRLPPHKILIDLGTFEYLKERDGQLLEIENKRINHPKPLMYFVRGHRN